MRIYYCAIIALFTSLALSQVSPAPGANAPSDEPQHHRHEDDENPLPPSSAAVSPDSAVITIEGVCDYRPDKASGSTAGNPKANASTPAKESGDSTCKTIMTKAQFENLASALNPSMTGMAKRQLAMSYPRLLLFADKAREMRLDQDPSFAERMRFASIQILAQSLNRYFDQQAKNISDADVQNYYNANQIKFERADVLRIIVPRQAQGASRPASGTQADDTMMALAQKLRVRAATGEDFQELQKEAFEAAHISSGSPIVSMGKISVARLPITQQKVFQMQPGQVSEVISDPSGYYIYKVVSKDLLPLSQSVREIRKSIAAQRVQDSINSLTNSLKFDLNPLYFGKSAATTSVDQQADQD